MTDRRTPPHHATRQHRVLAILAAAHAAGRIGVPMREITRQGVPPRVLDILMWRALIAWNSTGYCLPEHGNLPPYIP